MPVQPVFSSIDIGVNADADVYTDAWCGQGLRAFRTVNYELILCFIPNKCDRYVEIN